MNCPSQHFSEDIPHSWNWFPTKFHPLTRTCTPPGQHHRGSCPQVPMGKQKLGRYHLGYSIALLNHDKFHKLSKKKGRLQTYISWRGISSTPQIFALEIVRSLISLKVHSLILLGSYGSFFYQSICEWRDRIGKMFGCVYKGVLVVFIYVSLKKKKKEEFRSGAHNFSC